MRSSVSFAMMAFSSAAMAASMDGICYNSAGPATLANSDPYQSYINCRPFCVNMGRPIMALHAGGDCYCSTGLPPANDRVANSQCSTGCFGFGSDPCGSSTAWTFVAVEGSINNYVRGSGNSGNGGNSGNDSSSSSDPASSSSSNSNSESSSRKVVSSIQVVTSGTAAVTQVVYKTINAQPADTPTEAANANNNNNGGGGISSGAIAAAVVVSVVGSAAIIAAIIFFLKWKKERDDISSHRRIQSNSAFGDPPSITDSRLDHTMVERRTSNGSVFADNEDYSRKILRVANPDDR